SGFKKLFPSFFIQSVNSSLLTSGSPAKGSIHKNLASGSIIVQSATYGKSSKVKEICWSDFALDNTIPVNPGLFIIINPSSNSEYDKGNVLFSTLGTGITLPFLTGKIGRASCR